MTSDIFLKNSKYPLLLATSPKQV